MEFLLLHSKPRSVHFLGCIFPNCAASRVCRPRRTPGAGVVQVSEPADDVCQPADGVWPMVSAGRGCLPADGGCLRQHSGKGGAPEGPGGSGSGFRAGRGICLPAGGVCQLSAGSQLNVSAATGQWLVRTVPRTWVISGGLYFGFFRKTPVQRPAIVRGKWES